jgi:S-adenosylmethionine synthetase
LAKNVVGSGVARECEIQIAYAIGIAEPVSVMVNTFETGLVPDAQITKALLDLFDFTPAGIIEKLKLRRPVYRATAAYGHFGREEDSFSWESLDGVPKIRKALKLSTRSAGSFQIRSSEPLLSTASR